MSLALRKIGISLALGFVMINSVIAADWYVSPSGQNWYSGNQAQPFQTISKAIQEAQSGDTIYVMDGTYRNSNYNFINTTSCTDLVEMMRTKFIFESSKLLSSKFVSV